MLEKPLLDSQGKIKMYYGMYSVIKQLSEKRSIDTSPFSKKVDLANLKSNLDKLDIDKLK